MRADRMPLSCNGRGKPYSSIDQSGDSFVVRIDYRDTDEAWTEVRINPQDLLWMIDGYVQQLTVQLAEALPEETAPLFDLCLAIHGGELDLFARFITELQKRREASHE